MVTKHELRAGAVMTARDQMVQSAADAWERDHGPATLALLDDGAARWNTGEIDLCEMGSWYDGHADDLAADLTAALDPAKGDAAARLLCAELVDDLQSGAGEGVMVALFDILAPTVKRNYVTWVEDELYQRARQRQADDDANDDWQPRDWYDGGTDSPGALANEREFCMEKLLKKEGP